MKVQEIRAVAKELGIKPGKLRKADLIRVIQAEEGNFPCFQTALDYCDQLHCRWRDDCLTSSSRRMVQES